MCAIAISPGSARDGETAAQAETLQTRLTALIGSTPSAEVQVEASRLITTIIDIGDNLDDGERTLVEAAIAALGAAHGSIRVAQFARNRLELKHRNRRRGFVPWISRQLGDSAVYAMLVGVLYSALLWGVLFLLVIGIGLTWNQQFQTEFILPPREASPLAFAAFIGGLVSLLGRVDRFASLYVFDPFLIFVNSLLKPLIGTALALTAYAILKSGIVEIGALQLDHQEGQYRFVFWAFGFVAGFSERLAGDFIARAESVVGGKGGKREQPGPPA